MPVLERTGRLDEELGSQLAIPPTPERNGHSNGHRPEKSPRGAATPSPSVGRWLLALSLVMGAVSHGYNLFQYPLYITDEGIYMEQAWSVLRLGTLSPYTYFYDHAPAGWLAIAAWVDLLPRQFQTFGMSINAGR